MRHGISGLLGLTLAVAAAFAAKSLTAQAKEQQTAAAPQASAAPSPLVDRVGTRGFLQSESPSFARLPLQQKLVAYHLREAAIQLDPIFYDQMSDYGLPAKRLLGAMVEDPQRLPESSRQAIVDYAKLFFANGGNHNETTNEKFLPEIPFDDFARAAREARAKGARLGTAAQLDKTLEELKRPLFDPRYQVSITVKTPPPGEDILTASSNNFYKGVTLADLKSFQERYPLNSRVVKENGKIVEEVYRAGTPDGKVPPGRYAKELKAVNAHLEEAAKAADPEQAQVIRALVKFYQTGSPDDWRDFNIKWIRNDATVDFASGFIEVYRDPRGAKGSAQMVVYVRDENLAPLMKKLAANAVYFERKAPWLDKYKKVDVEPPVGKAVESVVQTGDFHVTTIGVNLPNEQDIREKYGTKSTLLTSSVDSLNATRGARVAVEFAPNADEQEKYEKYGTLAANLHTAMHEVIGHGSGKVAVPNDPRTYLQEYYSTLEEARADLVSYWNIFDPKLAELGVQDVQEVGRELYRSLARVGLTTLNRYPTGDAVEEDHDRNRMLIVNYLIEQGSLRRFERDGHWYIEVVDYDKAHEGVGKLLAEIMRIKAEGDYAAIKALVDKYAVRLDPAVRDDVVARYKKLDLPTYFSGVYGDLTLMPGPGGKPADVKITYPRDFLAQQLAMARKNGTLGF